MPTRPSEAPAAWLPAGASGTPAQIPWTRVGAGWYLVLSHAASDTSELSLVDPMGGRYLLHTFPPSSTPTLADWSGDGRRVALVTHPEAASESVQILDVATGGLHDVRLTAGAPAGVRFTRPDGLNLLVGLGSGAVLRTDLDGGVTARLAPVGTVVDGAAALDTSDGRDVVLGTPGGLAVVANQGGAVRALPGTAGCTPVRDWGDQLLTGCTTDGVQRLFLVDLATGQRTGLSAPHRGAAADYGDLDAFRLPSGLYLDAEGGCGSLYVGRAAADGSVAVVPGQRGPVSYAVGTAGSDLAVVDGPQTGPSDCASRLQLVLLDPVTGASRPLAGSVLGVLAFGDTGPSF